MRVSSIRQAIDSSVGGSLPSAVMLSHLSAPLGSRERRIRLAIFRLRKNSESMECQVGWLGTGRCSQIWHNGRCTDGVGDESDELRAGGKIALAPGSNEATSASASASLSAPATC